MRPTYREEKSIKDLELKDIIRMGRNDYYYNEDRILSMTKESPDSRASKIKRQEERRHLQEEDHRRRSARAIWIAAGNTVEDDEVVICPEGEEPCLSNIEVVSRRDHAMRNLH